MRYAVNSHEIRGINLINRCDSALALNLKIRDLAIKCQTGPQLRASNAL